MRILTGHQTLWIAYHYIQEVVHQRQVELFFINSADNPADMFTKNLGRIKFTQFQGTLGLEIYLSKNALNTSTGVQSKGECQASVCAVSRVIGERHNAEPQAWPQQ